MALWQKRANVEEMLDRYFALCDTCFASFEVSMAAFGAAGICPDFAAAVARTHQAESEADDLRREIELTLYGKALLPESRGDLLGLVEAYDSLPNIAETVGFVLLHQRTEIPAPLAERFHELVAVNLRAYHAARRSVDALMSNPKATLHATKEVDMIESESDRLERSLIQEIFLLDTDNGTRLMFKEIVLLVGEISDRAEKVADRIGIIAIKRQI